VYVGKYRDRRFDEWRDQNALALFYLCRALVFTVCLALEESERSCGNYSTSLLYMVSRL